MIPTFTRGETFGALIELTPEEWAGLYPWQAIRAAALQGAVRRPLAVTADAAARTILLTADTTSWAERLTHIDVRIERASGVVYLPSGSTMDILISAPVTETS